MARVPVLTYHQVDAAAARGAPYRSLCVSPASFARQMMLLRLAGYRGLCMSAILPYLRGEREGKVVGITFDDGYLNNLEHALPVLQRHGFSATCYAVSGRLGASNDWDHAKGVPARRLMDAAQLRAWADAGQEVGSHTRSHADLPTLDPQAARQEIVLARAELEQVVGREVRHFCYPYGHYRAEHAQWAREAGYHTATTTRRGRVATGADPFALPRVPVLRTTTLPLFWLKLATAYEDGKGA